MSRTCAICSRTPQKATVLSNRVRATKFNPTTTKRQRLNLQSARLPSGKKIVACARCIKTMNKS